MSGAWDRRIKVSDERFFTLSNSLLNTALRIAGDMTRKRQRWQPFQAAAGEDLERRKVFTHAMTRKRQRW